jgi:hypothetical protein
LFRKLDKQDPLRNIGGSVRQACGQPSPASQQPAGRQPQPTVQQAHA